MCIRDRGHLVFQVVYLDGSIGRQPAFGPVGVHVQLVEPLEDVPAGCEEDAGARADGAVSYTHLDVYKRQATAFQDTGVAMTMLDLFTGGALSNFSVFSLGIMPYITARCV